MLTAAEDALTSLRNQILSGTLRAGHKLHQEELAESLGMSRIPVRDAIRSLVAEGLVLQAPRKTAQVAPLTQDDLTDLYQLRLAVEPVASALAVARLTASDIADMRSHLLTMEATVDHSEWLEANDAFHAALYRQSGRQRMIALLDLARAQTRRYTDVRLAEGPPDLDSEHRLIFRAVERRDAASVRSLVEAHLYSGHSTVMRQLELRDQMSQNGHGSGPGSLEGGAGTVNSFG